VEELIMSDVHPERQIDAWFRLSEEERRLRLILARVVHGETHAQCFADRYAHVPLHVTALWTDHCFGFCLKFEALEVEGLWLVILEDEHVVDLAHVDKVLKSRGSVVDVPRGDDQATEEWFKVAEAFLRSRGALRSHG
jgi:hypothetical protein